MRVQSLPRPELIESGPLVGEERASLRPSAGELVLEVAACAVCRTDLQIVTGDVPARRLPIVPGHQVVGTVSEVGAGVDGWSVGDRAGVGWLAGTCGACRFCESGRENLCEAAEFTGWDRDGGYAQQAMVRADFALRLPDESDDLNVAPLLCGGIIGYRALRASRIEPGGRLGLYGFGSSARLALQVAAHWGCEVHVATRSEPERRRALELGATSSGGVYETPPAPLDAAVTFAPVGEVVVAALKALDRGGTVAINAIHLDRIPEFSYDDLWMERQIRSVANYTRQDAREFLAIASEIQIRTDIERVPLNRANDALRRLSGGNVTGTLVLEPQRERQ